MQVIYAGAGDGSWSDMLEPNDGPEDLLGPAPIVVGTLYRDLNLLPRTLPRPSPTPSEDRDWYTWQVIAGQCYLAFTGDVNVSSAGSVGKDRVRHALRLWRYAPTKEGRRVLAEYNPTKDSAEGGFFSAVRACASNDGVMAAEVYNYGHPLVHPTGSTYTFGVVQLAGKEADPPHLVPEIDTQSRLQESSTYPTAVRQPQPQLLPQLPPTPTSSAILKELQMETSLATPSVVRTNIRASLSLVAYLDMNGNNGPDPGEGLRRLAVALLDRRTNSVQQVRFTDSNGHAEIEWEWHGPVRVSLPDLNWLDSIEGWRMQGVAAYNGVWSASEDGGLYLEVRVPSTRLPAVIP